MSGKRESHPPARLMYDQPGNSRDVQLPAPGKKSSEDSHPPTNIQQTLPSPKRVMSPIASSTSTSHLIQLKEVETSKQLLELEEMINEQINQIEDDISNDELNLSNETDKLRTLHSSEREEKDIREQEDKVKSVKRKIDAAKQKIERIKVRYERKRKALEKKLELDKQLINLTSDEQKLDEVEEEIANNWIEQERPLTPNGDRPPAPNVDGPPPPKIDAQPAPNADGPPAPNVDGPPAPNVDVPPIPNADKAPTPQITPPGSPKSEHANESIRSQPRSNSSECGSHNGDLSQALCQLASAVKQMSASGNTAVEKKLPRFDGNPADWCKFESACSRTFKKFSNAENLVRLQDSLQGQASVAVEHLMANPNNVKKITEVLEKRFGRPELVLDHLIEKTKSTKGVDLLKPETIVTFGTAVEALVTNIKSFKRDNYLLDRQLVIELLKKLPMSMETNWYEWLMADKKREANIANFNDWIQPKVDVALMQVKPSFKTRKEDERESKEKNSKNRHVGATTTAPEDKKAFCENCKISGHTIIECRKFGKLSVKERRKAAWDNRLCFKCLRVGHRTPQCSEMKSCGNDGCQVPHHALLHDPNYKNADSSRPPSPNSPSASTASTGNTNPTQSTPIVGHCGTDAATLLKYVPVRVKGPRGEKTVFAFLDDGSHLTMVDKELARELGLEGPMEDTYISVYDGTEKKQTTMTVEMEISGTYRFAKAHKLKDVKVVNLDLAEQSYDIDKITKQFPQLSTVPLQSQLRAKPQILIGSNYWRLSYPREKVEPSCTSPAAIKTKLGWILVGAEDTSGVRPRVYSIQTRDDDLTETVRQFICLDSLGSCNDVPIRSKEDVKSLKILEETTQKVGARWETGLLWKDNTDTLPESKTMALKRLYTIERKADGDPEFAQLYTSRVQEYIDKGYLAPSQSIMESERKWYLPHFFAFNPNKKPRFVFDAAAKSFGKSFNDFLMKGPDLLRPLPAVLLRFRRHPVAVTGDIKEMFHQVHLRETDQVSQTILYRGMDRKHPPKEYQMTVLFFGSACSPCSAIYVKDKNASEWESTFPDSVKAITLDTYMDDFLSGAANEEEAIKLQQEVTQIHASGGFPICKWSSSSVKVLQSIPADLRASGDRSINMKSDIPQERTLGLIWNPSDDNFRFQLNLNKISDEVMSKIRRPTKRELASFIMSLFDPLGFLTPLKVKGLIIFQNTWEIQLGWDDEITADLQEKWDDWLVDLKQINEIRIPRCIFKEHTSEGELHIFCDASEEAYAAAAYLRSYTGGSYHVILLASKGRVKPLKGLSIPRMELQAALLGVRLSKFIKQAFSTDLTIERTTYWSDSQTVLCWLYSTTGRFSQFVSNRINEILLTSSSEEWRWIPSLQNVADDATRSRHAIKLTSNSRWIQGPEFLQLSEETWPVPQLPEAKPEDLELKRTVITIQVQLKRLPLPNENDYSSWWKLMLKTASWIRGVRILQKKLPRSITLEDINRAQILWAKQVQIDCFADEIKLIKKNSDLLKSNRLYQLSPVINQDGLLTIKGRLKNSKFPEGSKHPIILDPNHRYTQLLIKWHHEINAHQGQETVLAELRKNYWIIGARTTVRSVIGKCVTCRIKNAATGPPPEMGNLPEARLAVDNPAFTHTGVDLFGPLEVTIGRRHEKRWGVIFTCLTTRASHLDLVPSLSTSDFIDCLVRFNCRRGPATHLWSDNGTNFRGADKELRALINSWDQKEIHGKLLRNGTEWHFNPPSSPHMGGAWERMVGLTKRILGNLLNQKAPKEYTLLTFLAEVENILNSRPLTAVSPDPRDPDPITPNHLLKMKCCVGGITPNIQSGTKMWRQAQLLAEDFWNRWKREYLPVLNQRKKWHQEQVPIREGDVVVLVDDQAKRNEWKKAVVTETYPGKDGTVRVVKVRVPHPDGLAKKFSEFTRPVVKLCRIGVNENE